MHLLQGVPSSGCNFLLSTLKVLVKVSIGYNRRNEVPEKAIPAGEKALLDILPTNISNVITRLRLDPVLERFACCKKCFATYPPLALVNNNRPIYPSRCDFEETSTSPKCNMPLVYTRRDHRGEVVKIPYREFAYQPLREWLARILLRPGMEKMMDAAWERSRKPSGPVLFDIWDGPEVREFLGPDNITRFSECQNDEGHYIFSLFIDWFNPFRNRKGGKGASVGAIYMICLNLPPNIRHKLENVYLAGIIPGPKEPSTSQINHFLKPLVEELVRFWKDGIFYQQTRSFPQGRLVRCAVLPLVCDIPALRKTAGFSGHTATLFCSFCLLEYDQLNSCFDVSKFPFRNSHSHRLKALEWLMSDLEKREEITSKFGLRYTKLSDLPYFKIIEFSTLDAMHNLFLGVFQHHCRNLWRTPHVTSDKEFELEDIERALLDEEEEESSLAREKGRKGKKTYTDEEEAEEYQHIVDKLRKKSSISNAPVQFLVGLVKVNKLPVAATGKRGAVKADFIRALKVDGTLPIVYLFQ